jgi:hypothetical protein
MPEPVKIILQAETEQAVTALRNFLNTANPGLKQLAIGAKAATGELGNSRLAMMELGHVGRAMAEGLAAGVSPLRMLALEGPRLAQAASLAKIGLSTMVPALAAVAVAVGGGALIWHEWTKATREAEKAAKDLHEEFEGIAKIVTQLRDLEKAGLLSPAAAKKNLDLLTGKTKMYKSAEDGSLTTSPTSMVPGFATVIAPKSSPNDPTVEIRQRVMKQVQNQLATAAEVQKYINDQLSVPGGLDADEIAAKNKVEELRKKIHQDSLSDIEQEKEKIHDKYDAERKELEDLSKSMGKLLTPGQERQNQAALALSQQNEALAKQGVDLKSRDEELAKADAAFARGQQLFAETVRKENEDLDRELTSLALKQGKTREQIYQEEFAKRTNLLIGQLYQGLISNDEYTRAVQDATNKRVEGYNRERATLLRTYQEQIRTAQEGIRGRAGAILSDGGTDNASKAKELALLATETQMLLLQNTVKLAGARTDQERNELQREQNGLVELNGELMRHQAQIAPTFVQAMRSAVVQLKSEWGSLAIQIQQSFMDVYHTMITSISSALTGLIERTKTWGEALRDIGGAILNSIIGAIVKMFVTWIVQMTVLRLLQAVFGKESNQEASQSAAAWAPAAVAASIASYGAAAAIGTAAAIAGMAVGAVVGGALAQYDTGGYTGDGGRLQPAGIVHRGEFVMDADKTQRFRPLLEAMHQGRALPIGNNGDRRNGGQEPKIELHAHIWGSESKMEQFIRNNTNVHHTIIDVINQNVHLIRKRAS